MVIAFASQRDAWPHQPIPQGKQLYIQGKYEVAIL